MDTDPKATRLYQDLDTAFVNIWSLLRKLTERGFIGRVRVDLPDYSADVFMDGSATPQVREIDRATGTETIAEGSLHRLVLRARETPGRINVFEGPTESSPPAQRAAEGLTAPEESQPSPAMIEKEEPTVVPEISSMTSSTNDPFSIPDSSAFLKDDIYPTGSYQDWPAIMATSSALVSAVERAVNANGENFGNLFNRVRLQLADDYSFLDPMSRVFEYANGRAQLNSDVPLNIYISGLSEALRRCVERVAVGDRTRRVRERVALEMLAVARKHQDVLDRSGLQPQLDRIAGTRVM